MKLKHYSHVLIMLAVLIGAFAAYGAWYGQVGKVSSDAISFATQIQERRQNQASAQEAKEQLESALVDEASITGYFVDTDDVVDFLGSLQATGNAQGAKVEVVSVSAEPARPHGVLVLALRITGTFDSVLRTLGAIEYQPYDTTLMGLTLDTTDGGAAARQWEAAATLRVGNSERAAPARPARAASTTP